MIRMGLAIVTICLGAASLHSQEEAIKSESRKNETQSPIAFEQIESDSIAFVQEHHAELVTLLQSLKTMRQKEYEVAIREIWRTKKRLESLIKREPELHDMELEAWKLKSQIDLLMAKGFASDKSFDKAVLRDLIASQLENQKKRWKYEQATLKKREQQLDELLAKIVGHEDERIEQQLANHLKSVDSKLAKNKKPKQDAKAIKPDAIKPDKDKP